MGSTLKKCDKILKNAVILILEGCPLLCFHPVAESYHFVRLIFAATTSTASTKPKS